MLQHAYVCVYMCACRKSATECCALRCAQDRISIENKTGSNVKNRSTEIRRGIPQVSEPPSLSLSLSLSLSFLFVLLLPPNVSIAPYPRGGNILDPRYARRSRPKEPSDLLRHLNDVLSSLLLQQAGIDFRASAEPGEHSFQAAGCLIAR